MLDTTYIAINANESGLIRQNPRKIFAIFERVPPLGRV